MKAIKINIIQNDEQRAEVARRIDEIESHPDVVGLKRLERDLLLALLGSYDSGTNKKVAHE